MEGLSRWRGECLQRPWSREEEGIKWSVREYGGD